jgi:DHA1 family bicyclomycin/chloramphenicol resistance-like MFS transporter
VVDGTILLATAFGLRETNPLARRVSSSERTTYRDLVQDRTFAAWVVMIGLTFAAMFSYIAGSSFVLEDIYGVSPLVYGLAFGVNACGIVAFSMANRRLLRTRSPRQLLLLGVVVAAVGGVALVAAVLAGKVGLAGLLPCLFVAVAPIGLVLPNAAALALAPYPHAAGRASALIGLLQFGCGAVVAPVVGIAGKQTAIPMALLVCGCTTAALAVAVRSAAGGKRRSAIPLQEAA